MLERTNVVLVIWKLFLGKCNNQNLNGQAWGSFAAGLFDQLLNIWQNTTLSVFVLAVCLHLQHAFFRGTIYKIIRINDFSVSSCS
jgi:hypothetical protein